MIQSFYIKYFKIVLNYNYTIIIYHNYPIIINAGHSDRHLLLWDKINTTASHS